MGLRIAICDFRKKVEIRFFCKYFWHLGFIVRKADPFNYDLVPWELCFLSTFSINKLHILIESKIGSMATSDIQASLVPFWYPLFDEFCSNCSLKFWSCSFWPISSSSPFEGLFWTTVRYSCLWFFWIWKTKRTSYLKHRLQIVH